MLDQSWYCFRGCSGSQGQSGAGANADGRIIQGSDQLLHNLWPLQRQQTVDPALPYLWIGAAKLLRSPVESK